MEMKEINEKIERLESEVKELKLQKAWILGHKKRIFCTGESYLRRRDVIRFALTKGINLPWDKIDWLRYLAISKATNGEFEKIEDVNDYDQWVAIRDIYSTLIKQEIDRRINVKVNERWCI